MNTLNNFYNVPFDWAHLPYHLNPVALSLGPLQIRWYGLMYVIAAFIVYFLTLYRIKTENLNYSKNLIEDAIILSVFCMLIGGRLGYVFFYNLGYFLKHPIQIISPFDFSDGIKFVGIYGMSYHGGLVGVIFAFIIFCKKYKIGLMKFIDLFVPSVPLGYMFGRIGNFINGELFGRVTDVPWGMYFPAGGPFLRYPSQLYEAFFEGLFLFVLLWALRKKKMFDGFLFTVYLIGYGIVRFFIEFIRQPDEQLGFVWGPFSMGQVLCFIMVCFGVGFYYFKRIQSRNKMK